MARTQNFRHTLTPGAIEAALDNAQHTAEHTDEVVRAVTLELEEARYQAARAERQYDAVEPENRLVAETLERRWDEALARVGELDRRLEQLKGQQLRQPVPNRERLLALAQRFPETWSNPATDYRTKKRLVRLLIEEIIANVVSDQRIELTIHWKGGKHSILYVRKSRTGEHSRTTQREVVEVVRDLARTLPDAQIARVLNRLGYRTGAGNTWMQSRVDALRNNNSIAVFNPERDADRSAGPPAQRRAEAQRPPRCRGRHGCRRPCAGAATRRATCPDYDEATRRR